MTTTWVPMTRFEPRSWLLANGEVIDEPPLEQTSTGRKVRVANTTDSFYAKDLEDLLHVAATQIATAKNTKVFLALHGAAQAERKVLGDLGPAKLHLTEATAGTTTAWWKFRHPSMPYAVTVIATLTEDRYKRQSLSIKAVQPRAVGHYSNSSEAAYDILSTPHDALYGLPSRQTERWGEHLRDNPLAWTSKTIEMHDRQFPASRMAAESLLSIVREMEDLETIQWFDFRESDPAYMELDLYESNVNSQFISDLTDFLDGSPTVDKAADLYLQLIDTLKACGLVLERDDDKNDFMRALNTGTVRVTVSRLAEENNEIDHQHAVVVNLVTGTMLVECSARTVNNNQIAEQWEEAKTVAALTGEEDELLAYARAYREQDASRRTKRILKQRGA